MPTVLVPVLVLGPAGVAPAEEDLPARESVVGELVQAWVEHEPHHAHEPADDGPLTWVQTAEGESVRLSTEDLASVVPAEIPLGATVEVVVGDQVEAGAVLVVLADDADATPE